MRSNYKYRANNVKHWLILVGLLFLIFPDRIFAQNDFQIEPPGSIAKVEKPDTSIQWHGVYLDPYFNMGAARPSADAGTYTGGISFNAGAELCYIVSDHFGIIAGLQYGQYSYTYVYNNVASTASYFEVPTAMRSASNDTTVLAGYVPAVKYTMNYIGIPVMVRYFSSPMNKFGFYMEAGITTNVLISSTVSGSVTSVLYKLSQFPGTNYYTYSSSSNSVGTVSESNPDISVINLSLNLGVGVIIPIAKNTSLVIEYSPQIGLLNLGTGKNDVVGFGSSQYYFFGNGNYGSINIETAAAKLIIKI